MLSCDKHIIIMIFITCCHGYVNSTDQSTVTNILVDDKPLTGNESCIIIIIIFINIINLIIQ